MHAASQLRPRRISISSNTAALFISSCVFSRVRCHRVSCPTPPRVRARPYPLLSPVPTSPHAGYKWRHYSLIIRDIMRGIFIVQCVRRGRVAPNGQQLSDHRGAAFFLLLLSNAPGYRPVFISTVATRTPYTSLPPPPAGKDERFIPRCIESMAIPSYNRFRAR